MSIHVKMQLRVQGRGKPRDLATIDIWTETDNQHHRYLIDLPDRTIEGKVKKTCSGHQNILHVLQDVLANADLSQLEPDYIPRGGIIR